jgi:hypothetical protein
MPRHARARRGHPRLGFQEPKNWLSETKKDVDDRDEARPRQRMSPPSVGAFDLSLFCQAAASVQAASLLCERADSSGRRNTPDTEVAMEIRKK